MADGPLIPTGDGLRAAIRLSPWAKAAKRGCLLAVAATAEGRRVVRASVTPPPQDGQANEALLRLLARPRRGPRRDLAIDAGTPSRRKTVQTAGDQHQLGRIRVLIAALPGR